MARFPYKRGPRVYPPIKDKLYKKIEDLGVTMNNDRTLLDREGRVLRKSRTYKQMGINEEDVRQRFRHYYYNEIHPWALEEIDIHIDPDIKEITPPPHMIPKPKKGRGGLLKLHRAKKRQKLIKNMRRLLRRVDRLEDSPMKYKILDNMEKEIRRTKPKKGRGGLIDFHKWKKKKKKKVMKDFLDDPNPQNASELMSSLYAAEVRGREIRNRIAGRLKKHPEDNVIKFPNKFAGWVGDRKPKPKKPKKKPKKNMGGLLSLYE